MIEVIGLVVFFASVVLFGYALFCWALRHDHKKALARQKQPPEENREAPYKLEPSNIALPVGPSDLVAVSDQPKKRGRPLGSKNKPRKYTKRSKYWSSPKVKTKMSKARKARKSSKSK